MTIKCVCTNCGHVHTRDIPEENPGMSIVERDFQFEKAFRKIRSMGHISRHEFREFRH